MDSIDNKTKTNNVHRLVALADLDDWKVHEDDTDIRGWTMYANEVAIGEVKNLIADTEEKKVLYIEVELDPTMNNYWDSSYREKVINRYHTYYGSDEDRRIIVPIGTIEIDKDKERVLAANNLTPKFFSNGPRFKVFDNNTVTPRTELLTAKYYTDRDEFYKDSYRGGEYEDIENYKFHSFTPGNTFYQTDLFRGNRYFGRYRNQKSNNPLRYKTDAPGI